MTENTLNLSFLEKLCNAFGPSGHEREVQRMVLDYGKPYADEVLFDKTGSVIFKRGTTGPKIMLAGHSDEIGYLGSAFNRMLEHTNVWGIINHLEVISYN